MTNLTQLQGKAIDRAEIHCSNDKSNLATRQGYIDRAERHCSNDKSNLATRQGYRQG